MFGVICTPHDCRREDTTRSVNISAASAVHGNVCHTHHGSETSGAAVLYKCEHMSMAMTLGLVPGVRPSVVVVFFFSDVQCVRAHSLTNVQRIYIIVLSTNDALKYTGS